MGCDIHCYAERQVDGKYEIIENLFPFDRRDYGLFAWLAGVRNYSAITPISEPRGLPEDVSTSVKEDFSRWGGDAHSDSWLSVPELLAVDYDVQIEDRRCMRPLPSGVFSGAQTCEPGEGIKQDLKTFLGVAYFEDLEALKDRGADRVVFWFDC